MATYIVSSGTTSSGLILGESDCLHVFNGGAAIETTVNSGGSVYVSSTGMLNSTAVNSSGLVYLNSAASAMGTTINNGGYMYVPDSGVLSNTQVNSGGSVYLGSGGTQTGVLDMASGGRFHVSSGAVIDFDISERTPSSAVLVSNFSGIIGTPSFTLTISSDQTSGQYELASGVNYFGGTITVRSGLEEDLGILSIGNNLSIGEKIYSLAMNEGNLTLQIGTEAPAEDTLLPYTMPQAEYMYGCIPTAVGMLLGYYDLYGYVFNGLQYDFSDLIEGTISVDSRGSDGGSIYDMSDPSVLANFIASEGYVSRFYNQTPAHELPWTYVGSDPDSGLNVPVWDSLADYLGTGQYWRGNNDLSTRYYFTSLDALLSHGWTYNVNPDFVIPAEYADFKYGLYVYAGTRGYQLDTEATRTLAIGSFSFDDYMAEIDAGHPVLLSMQSGSYGHMVIAYGYNSDSQEVIFDDMYRTGCRMKWDGEYKYGGINYSLCAVSLVAFDVSGQEVIRPAGCDLNGDRRSDIVMTIIQDGHSAEGATGAWLIQENQTAVWGDLSTRNSDWEIFGTGKTAAGKKTDDVYIRSSDNVIGAWTTGDDGSVTGWATIGEFSADTRIVGLGDFNGNSQADLLLRNASGAVGCYFTGGETTGWNYFQSLGEEWKLSAVGDLNGDGRDDVVLKHDAGFAGSWLTQADGTMAWADLDTLPDGFEIVGAGDFNGDGTDDVLLKSGYYYGAWLVNDGNAAGWMGLGDLGDVTVEQIADFNGDGMDDLRIRTATGVLGTQLVMGEDQLSWQYYGSVGSEWSTRLAALS